MGAIAGDVAILCYVGTYLPAVLVSGQVVWVGTVGRYIGGCTVVCTWLVFVAAMRLGQRVVSIYFLLGLQ